MSAVGPDEMRWVLWAGTLGLESPIQSRIDAAAATGYHRISVSPLDVLRATEEGLARKELRARLTDAGIEVAIDPVMTWYGPPLPGVPLGDVSVEEILTMSEALEAVSLGAIANPAAAVPPAELAEPFALLCDRAAEVGARVHLEFMPMLPIDDVAAAWAIVSGAARDNGGLLVDTWHFFRGNPDFSVLARIPGERIFGVQVADAAPFTGDLGRDTFERLMPGDGELDLVAVVEVLDGIGGLGCVGPEVISPLTAAMHPEEAARVARARISAVIERARSGRRGPVAPPGG